ncbi:MAG: ABC transporter permease [Bacteroidetes bacterium]|jgi:ABC-2 type transport system permease protein|nr:ABC transporter permease [Bacteroidota bacterium]
MWKLAKKDLRIFFTDKKAIFLALLLPIGLITLFALAFGGVAGGDEEESSPILVLYSDEDNTATSKKIISILDSISGIELIPETKANAIDLIKNGDRIANIIIYSGFEDSIKYGNTVPMEMQFDQSREMEVSVLQNIVLGNVSSLKGENDAAKNVESLINQLYPNVPNLMRDSLKQNMLDAQIKENRTVDLVTMTSLVGDESSNWGLIQAVAGTAILMLLFSVSSIGQSMLEEKENGVLKKLLQSPVKPFEIMMSKMLTATIISVFQLTVMFIFSWLAFALDIFMDIPALIIMILFTAIACSSFGVLLSAIVTTKKQADSLGTIIILFMSAVGGSMIPLYIMPSFMQDAAVISVNYWSIQGFYDIFWRKTGIESIMENILVLGGITIVVLAVSGYFFRRNILKLT